jgi:hypothetical protein
MQKLALMMAVMILGMSPAHGCSIGAEPGNKVVRDQAEVMLPSSKWSGDDGKALMTEDRVSSTTAKGGPPVEPGGFLVGRILQQIQQGVEGLVRIRNEVLRIGQGAAKEDPEERDNKPGLGEKSQGNGSESGSAPKAAEALKKGADATRGRGQRKSRLYQRAGIRN